MDAAVSWEFEKTVGLSIDALCKLGITRHGYDSDRNCYAIQFLVFSETSPKPPPQQYGPQKNTKYCRLVRKWC